MTDEPPPSDKYVGWLNAVKGLTISNVLVIAMLVVIAIPAYLAYRAINDQDLLDRFFSHYKELSSQNVGCTLREARYRGGTMYWAISTGFAYQGADKYIISVILENQPNAEGIASYCEAIKLIADKMLSRGDDADDVQ
jgi:hypothetical protein